MRWTRILAASLAALCCTTTAVAQSPSSAPIRIIVPYGPGGLVDTMSRIMAKRMEQTLGQPVVVENRAGANANIGAAHVAQSPPDGRTLLASASFFSTNSLIQNNLNWSPSQLTPVARFAISPNVYVVPAKSEAATLKDFLARARENPGMPVMDAGQGAPQTMVQLVLEDAARATFTHVQYRGGVSYVPDIISGTLQGGVVPFNVALGLVKSGQLKALAVTSASRSALLPDVPTMAEAGFAEAGVDSWLGYHVPAGTPPEVVKRLMAATQEAASNEEVRARFTTLGAESAFLDTPAFGAFLAADMNRARRVVSLVANRPR